MTTKHPAQGPVSLKRLHQIREILSKASAQSDGGNLGYAMADAVKVIDGAIAAFGAEPVAWLHSDNGIPAITRSRNVADSWFSKGWNIKPLYTTPPASVVPDAISTRQAIAKMENHEPCDSINVAYKYGWNACRAAMLQAGTLTNEGTIPATQIKPVADLYAVTSPEGGETSFTFDAAEAREFIKSGWSINQYVELWRVHKAINANHKEIHVGWIPVSERMPENDDMVNIVIKHVDGSHYVFTGQWWGSYWNTDSDCIDNENVTHWMPLPAAPQQEVK